MSRFYEQLAAAWRASGSLLCVGLDPDLRRLPAAARASPQPVFEFNRRIVEATIDLVCAYKPQFAFYAAFGLERQLEQTIEYIKALNPALPIILDAKRGDIGSTAALYAKEAFERYGADAVTVNPYLGGEALAPFLEYAERGVVALCRTSNPGAAEFQDLECAGRPLHIAVAERACADWNGNRNVALVMGAGSPRQLGEVRRRVGDMPILVPGIGAQGGDLAAVVAQGQVEPAAAWPGLVVNASRAVIYAWEEDGAPADFAQAARTQAERLVAQIKQAQAGARHAD